MLAASLVLLLQVVVVSDLAQAVHARLAALDQLSIEYTHSVFRMPADRSPLDREAWGDPFDSFPNRIHIVRPDVLAEFLKDDPNLGYEPVVASTGQLGYVSRHPRPAPDGKLVFHVVPREIQGGFLRWSPILQVLDVHMQDSTVPLLSIARMFDEGRVTIVRTVGSVISCAATVPMTDFGYTVNYDFDLNDFGTPLRVRSTLQYDDPELLPVTWEQFVLETQLVNGAEFPTEAIVTVHNPNVDPKYRGVHHYTVTSVLTDPALTQDALRVHVVRANSIVHEFGPNGSGVHRVYDENGALLRELETLSGPEPLTADERKRVSRDSLNWRKGIPIAAAFAGVLAVVGVRFLTRRR